MRHRRTVGLLLLVVSIVGTPALAGCSDDDPAEKSSSTSTVAPATTTSTSSTTTTAAPTTTTAPDGGDEASSTTVAGTTPTDPVPEGMSFGFVTAVDVDGATITIDIAELLTGDEAVTAAIEDGVLEPGETSLDNDYYIRNQNPKVRVAPVSGTVELKVLVNPGTAEPVDGTFAQFAGHVAERTFYESGLPVQIVAAGGVVSRIDEVFFP